MRAGDLSPARSYCTPRLLVEEGTAVSGGIGPSAASSSLGVLEGASADAVLAEDVDRGAAEVAVLVRRAGGAVGQVGVVGAVPLPAGGDAAPAGGAIRVRFAGDATAAAGQDHEVGLAGALAGVRIEDLAVIEGAVVDHAGASRRAVDVELGAGADSGGACSARRAAGGGAVVRHAQPGRISAALRVEPAALCAGRDALAPCPTGRQGLTELGAIVRSFGAARANDREGTRGQPADDRPSSASPSKCPGNRVKSPI